MKFQLANANGTGVVSGVAFADALPAGLMAPNGTTAPCGGSLVIAGGNTLTFTGGTLAAGGNCKIGRAACRERGGISEDTGAVKKKKGKGARDRTKTGNGNRVPPAPNPETFCRAADDREVLRGGQHSVGRHGQHELPADQPERDGRAERSGIHRHAAGRLDRAQRDDDAVRRKPRHYGGRHSDVHWWDVGGGRQL